MDKAFRILLIEDDRYISGFTAVSLRKEGYEVDVAQSADEGLFLYASPVSYTHLRAHET